MGAEGCQACSPLANVSATRQVLEAHGLRAKKSLGQNFLVDDGVVRHICDMSQVGPDDVVLEVGPGIGTLTCALLPRCKRVVAVEQDAELVPVLRDTCAPWADRLSVVNADATCVGPDDLPARPGKLVSNLPYNVAATVVLDVLERMPGVASATVMVQREVADRMRARPGGKDYGAYTVKLSLFARPMGSFTVPPSSFMPAPHVVSTVIRLDRDERSCPEGLRRAAATMADAAFWARRKTMSNSCRAYFKAHGVPEAAEAVGDMLAEAGVDARTRGETLQVADFVTLGAALARVCPKAV